MSSICVVGAGVCGLSCAYRIAAIQPDVKITVMADKFLAETTSHGAGACFFCVEPHPTHSRVYLTMRSATIGVVHQVACGNLTK